MIGLDLTDLAVDGGITNAPGGGETSGRSPVDRGKQGRTRSTVTDGGGVPLHLVATGANRPDGPLLGPTLAGRRKRDKLDPLPPDVTTQLDRGYGYDSTVTRSRLDRLGVAGQIARRGVPAPVPVGARWVVEQTQSWMNGYGKPRRCTERRAAVVVFSLFLAAAFVVTRQLNDHARARYRWPTRPTSRRLR